MAVTLANGAVVAIASTYGTSVNMTAVTNASPAVATLASGHGVTVGDYLEVTSGWEALNGRIVRASVVATNDITFESINTSSTTTYPAGTGTGTIRRITAWTNLSQIQGVAPSGGDQQYADTTPISARQQTQIPTTTSPIAIGFTLFDDPSLSFYTQLRTASESGIPYAVRFSFTNGAKLVANAYWSLRETPNIATNQPLTIPVSLTYSSRETKYAT
jgi:hypothetical protein